MKTIVRFFIALIFPLLNGLACAHKSEKNKRLQMAVRGKAKHIGEGVCIQSGLEAFGVDALSIGDNVHIGEDTYIRADGGLTIGDHTQISRRVVIYTHNHNYKGGRLPFDETLVCKPVHIGSYVWIGMGVTILAGADIGDGAIIGAGCVIKGEVPENAIVSRNDSQKIIGYRDEEHVEKLLQSQAFSGASGLPR